MKKIILAATAAAALSTSVMAFDLKSDNESVVISAGYNAFGSEDNVKDRWSGSTTAGDYGAKKDAGYEVSVALEENVPDFQFGTRKTVTLYNHGNAELHDGNYYKKTTNYGLDFTYNVYYKVTKYFKPYVGVGFGINQSTFDGEGADFTSKVNYDPTLNGAVGASGNLIVGIGYYVEYKYRLADHSDQVLIVATETGTQIGRYEINGVNGDQLMVGVNYKF